MYAQAAAPPRDTFTPNGPKPVFIQARDFPPSDKLVTGEELYCALSKCVAFDNITGIQRIGSLWRIYLSRHEDRVKLITQGLHFRSAVIPVHDRNPFTKSYNEELTRVTVKDIPLSVGDELIKSALEKMKCKIKGDMSRQKLRVNGQLVNCLNGDRVCYIEPPSQPLARMFTVANIFRGRIFHPGQPEQVRNCSKCLETGHHASQCNKEIKCKVCKQFGHKSTSCPDNENVLRHSATNEVINTGNNATAAAQPDDETGRMTDGQGQQPDTTRSSHASSSASTQRTDDVNTRTKVNRQSDISYFLRTNKPTVSTPGHTDNERDRTCEQTEQRSEDSNSFSSDDSRTDEEQQTLQKSPTPKKKPKKKAEKKKGSTRK